MSLFLLAEDAGEAQREDSMPVYKLRAVNCGVSGSGHFITQAPDLLTALSFAPQVAFAVPRERRDRGGPGWYIDVLDESDRLLLSIPALPDLAPPCRVDRATPSPADPLQ